MTSNKEVKTMLTQSQIERGAEYLLGQGFEVYTGGVFGINVTDQPKELGYYVRVIERYGRLTINTTSSSWTVKEAIEFQKELTFAITILEQFNEIIQKE